MIEVHGLTKHFGPVRAVHEVSFTAPAGEVTGFLGGNGAGKSTTLRMLVGLTRPDAGSALVGGRPYTSLTSPRSALGAVLDARFHPGRTARDHLEVVATAAAIDRRRIDDVLGEVDLADDAERRVGGFSLGMRQRLALAVALLGDPSVLVLDEPANGLDPPGITWLRQAMRRWAGEGRTVLVSSHVLAEVAQVVDRVVIIDRGRVVHEGPLDTLGPTTPVVEARTPDVAGLVAAVAAAGWDARPTGPDSVAVEGATPAQVGRVAATEGLELHGLATATGSERLEAAFLALTEHTPTDHNPVDHTRNDHALEVSP
jgi:ABC-2 type transport system ATP-binding protein